MRRAAVLALACALLGALPGAGPEPRPPANYGDSVDVRPTGLEAAAMTALAQTMTARDGRPLELDPRLVAAARDLARAIQDDLPNQDSVIAGGVSRVLHFYGVYDPAYDAGSMGFGAEGDVIAGIRLRYVERKVQPMTQMGVGVAPPRPGRTVGIAVVLLTDRRARLEKFPRAVPCPSSWTLRGRLVNGSRGLEPRVAMTLPGGEVKNVPVSRTRDSFSATVLFDTPGTYRLEVAAMGEGRVEMSALMQVRAGEAVLNREGVFEVEGPGRGPETEAEAEEMMLDMLNEVRRREGLGVVLPDPALYRLARAHARDMKDNNFVGHVSPTAGPLAERVTAAGVKGSVSENVALEVSLAGAMNALLQSPLHRKPIIDPDTTRVGIGVVFDDGHGRRRYYIVQEFGG